MPINRSLAIAITKFPGRGLMPGKNAAATRSSALRFACFPATLLLASLLMLPAIFLARLVYAAGTIVGGLRWMLRRRDLSSGSVSRPARW